MSKRETAYQILERQSQRIHELEEKLRVLDMENLQLKARLAQIDVPTTRAINSKPPFVQLLKELFSQHSLWKSSDLKTAVIENGYKKSLLFNNPEVDALPISKFRADADDADEFELEEGEMYWRAQKGWPK